jgi:ADP-heptose:LPS heptosyltransferase
MKLELKRNIDTLVGLPALIAMNFFARLLGFLLQRDHAVEPAATIVVAKFQGMGSLAIAKPAISRLRQARPDAKIIFLGTPSTSILAHEMSEFDEVLTLKDNGLLGSILSLTGILTKLWKLKIDWFFDLEVYSKLSSIIATLSCARNRTGFAVDSVRHRRYVHTHLIFFNRYEYLGRAYDRLFGLLYPTNTVLAPKPGWKFDLAPLPSLSTPYIVINMHCGELALERKWPREHFEQLIARILETYPDWRVILIGHGKTETAENELIPKHPRVENLAGKLSLTETIRCLSFANAVVSGDSGPLHLALCGQAPVLGLYGPTLPLTYFPEDRPKSLALSEKIYCSPCVHHWSPPPCGGNNQCMKMISVERVWSALQWALGANSRFIPAQLSEAKTDPSYYAGLVSRRAA